MSLGKVFGYSFEDLVIWDFNLYNILAICNQCNKLDVLYLYLSAPSCIIEFNLRVLHVEIVIFLE